MNQPLVSVVIAAWNAARFLPETLASAVGQTYPNREIILVDDGSTDDTRDRIAPWLDRIRYFPRPHEGLAAARNFGMAEARGDYLAPLDADDLWLPAKLAVQVGVALRHPASGLVICDGVAFEEGREVRDHMLGDAALEALARSSTGEATGDFHRDLITGREWAGVPGQVLIPRAVYRHIGPFADLLTQDTEYWLRVSQHYPLTFHRDQLVRYRMHPAGLSGAGADRALRYTWGQLHMLALHRHRCSGTDRQLAEDRITSLARSLA